MTTLQIHDLSKMLPTYRQTVLPGVLRLLESAGLDPPCYLADANAPFGDGITGSGLPLFLVARIRSYATVGGYRAHHHSLLVTTNAALETWCTLTYPRLGNWELSDFFRLPTTRELARQELTRQYWCMSLNRTLARAPARHHIAMARAPWQHGRLAYTRVIVPDQS